jgi:HK97 family phage major capsid protein
MHTNTILALRELTASTSGLPVFLEIGQPDGNAVGNIFGHKVIANPWMDQIGAGNTPVYLADWSRFLTIGDGEELIIKRYDQSSPGFLTIYAEKRVVSTVRDVFAGLRIST